MFCWELPRHKKKILVSRKTSYSVPSQQSWRKESCRSVTEKIVFSPTDTWLRKTILAKINKEQKGFNSQLLMGFICIYASVWWFAMCSLWVIERLGDFQELAKIQAKEDQTRAFTSYFLQSSDWETKILAHNKITKIMSQKGARLFSVEPNKRTRSSGRNLVQRGCVWTSGSISSLVQVTELWNRFPKEAMYPWRYASLKDTWL